mmetsp:Transcript_102401/g.285340  ORF Transcript_102401/g.285340 Transcript_102401/m.285340 type:complete len:197 (+) Transcript_102401:94-684(+)|eukprot:CAMPEP_0179026862 /NCGR_PEP_ID=MMETSP0796-20121207/8738_1 /TAXON_ID=73915 /ORGANISM="Pyrodinium bahamense, Strain pbaha01" /LENGTH=196 /DNA_ID=CAMNT_0020722965 /DNA_START=83 /DNA_END=673 /DNA_ORIENTATION=+
MASSIVVDDPILLQGLPRQQPLRLMEQLEGVWVGEGVGEYPPHVPRFQFIQELIIEKAIPHSSRELNWSFRSVARNKATQEGLHSEWGYLRFHPLALDHGRLELVCTTPHGLCEVDEGTYNEDSFDVWTRYNGLTRPASASRPYVTEVRRWCEVRTDNAPMTMEYRVEMATERTPMQQHLLSRLRKQYSQQSTQLA